MSQYENVTVVKKANVYFDGKVTSRTVFLSDGSKVTLGVVLPGEYTFDTSQNEVMEVIAGSLDVQMKDADSVTTYSAGQAFKVPAGSVFTITAKEVSEYACSYSD